MSDEGPPLEFVTLWGIFALLMLLGQTHLINHGAYVSISYQVDELNGPFEMASLD